MSDSMLEEVKVSDQLITTRRQDGTERGRGGEGMWLTWRQRGPGGKSHTCTRAHSQVRHIGSLLRDAV